MTEDQKFINLKKQHIDREKIEKSKVYEPLAKRLSSPNDSMGNPLFTTGYKTGFPITPSGMT